jgi:hypothetical protein
MYGLPKGLDLSFFDGKECIQICFGLHQVDIHFHEDVSVAIRAAFRHQQAGPEPPSAGSALPFSAVGLLRLLGTKVEKVVGADTGTLTLSFSNGDVLEILDSEKAYESYEIRRGDECYVV